MNPFEQHSNWITVGEVINLIKKPVAAYADYIVKRFHAKLCQDCHKFKPCISPANCLNKKKPNDLCPACNGWYQKLASSHRNGNKSQIKWHQNCNSSKWSADAWEVAKFFMSTLGDNKSGVLDAESTDLSSLLNVLEWMEDVAFGGDKRVDLNLVKRLRSDVRNAWAHAAKQEMTKAQSNEAFEIANKFLEDLDKVYIDEKVKKCMKEIQFLQANGLTNISETELKALVLLHKELFSDISQIKEEIKGLNQDQNSDRQTIFKNEERLKRLEECYSRMEGFPELDCFREETKREFVKIREELQAVKNVGDAERFKPKSRIPEKLPTFIGREKEVKRIKSWLVENDSVGMVTLVGGPGFGKSTIAIEVCHRLSEEHEIPVIFSYLLNASTVAEVVRILCLNVGVQPGEDPESSLMVWLKSIKARIVLVLDNIEQLLEGETKPKFMELLHSLRMDSGHFLKIITTSRKYISALDMSNECCDVETMKPESSVELLKTCCPEKEFQGDVLIEMANLCGHVPLALRLLAFRLKNTDPAKLVEWLQDTPMEVLQTLNEKVGNAIEKSFKILGSTEKTHFTRLSVLKGNFNREAAQHVTELREIDTENALSELVERSLLHRSGDSYSIHLLIRSYLTDLEKFAQDRKRAQELMVEHFLRKCHDMSMLYWSKDGSNAARKALKENLHHVDKVLKIVQEASSEKNFDSVIVDTFVKSEIYQSSSRFFYNFILHILSPILVRSFLECCSKLAKRKKDVAIEVNFECLLADEIRRRVGWKSKEYKDRMELAKQTFDKIKENSEVKSHFYYCYGRYRHNLKQTDAESYLERSLKLRQSENPTDLEIVDQVVTLNELGNVFKVTYKNMEMAARYYNGALLKCKKCLGNHELTLNCYKRLGDIELAKKRYEEALPYYNSGDKIRKVSGLTDSSKSSVYFVKNRARCLFHLGRHPVALKLFNEVYVVVKERFDENANLKFEVCASLAEVHDAMKSGSEALEYAKKALEVKGELYEKCDIDKKKMNAIIRKWQGK